MDPVTHAVIGLVLGSQAGGELALTNGILMATALGAVAPDFDIVAQLWGDVAYLKQHRGISHSLPGLALLSLVLGGIMTFLYPGAGFWALVSWTFLGALSHSCLDLFNSYGVGILWPFNKKRWTANLLMIFDPVLIIIALIVLFTKPTVPLSLGALFTAASYLGSRAFMRYRAKSIILKRLQTKYSQVEVVVLPSLRNLFKWDFIARLPRRNMVGSVNLFSGKVRISHRLYCGEKEVIKAFKQTNLGKVFGEFTPFFHVDYELVDNKFVGHFVDLRYQVKGRFLHNGTLIMNRDYHVEEAVFQPFSLSRRIYLPES